VTAADETAQPGGAGRVALVTGGSRGIGRAIVVHLARAGHAVAFCYGSDAAGAAATEAEAKAQAPGARVLARQADIRDPAAVDAAFAQVEAELGPVTILVNNAGITRDGLLARMKDDDWRAVVDTNLTGAFLTIRRAARAMMRARFGRIVNVSSASGQMGQTGQANYAAAKAGLVGLTRSVARELASRRITCNIVAPGPIVTAMTGDMPDEWRAQIEGAVPLGRFGTPDEVAATVAFLTSEPAGYITGAIVPVDGGLAMGH
jgi:3-oxoacyl-[acyl-carrier protein] reductase